MNKWGRVLFCLFIIIGNLWCSCINENIIKFDTKDIVLGKWEAEVFRKAVRADTIISESMVYGEYQFLESGILRIIYFSDFGDDAWYYTDWWIDESNNNLLFPDPKFPSPTNTTYLEYQLYENPEYGILKRFDVEVRNNDEIIMNRSRYIDRGDYTSKELVKMLRL